MTSKKWCIMFLVSVILTCFLYAMFNILVITKFLYACLNQTSNREETLLFVNDGLALLRKYSNQAQILFALLQNLYINLAQEQELPMVDIETEQLKLKNLKETLKILFTDFQ